MPEDFLHSSGKGGGVIQGSASESVLVSMLAARNKAFKKHSLCSGSRLVAYCSKLVSDIGVGGNARAVVEIWLARGSIVEL